MERSKRIAKALCLFNVAKFDSKNEIWHKITIVLKDTGINILQNGGREDAG